MEEFEKIDWLPNIEDIIDEKFVNEERMQSQSSIYRILNGIFQDPFQDIRPKDFKPKEEPNAISNQKKGEKKPKGKRGRKKKQKPKQK